MLREIMDSSMIVEARTSKVISIFIISLIIASIVFLIIAFKYRYYLYDHYLGYVIKKNDNYYITLYVENNKIPIFRNSIVIVGEKEVDFQILEISKEYYIFDNKKYHLIIIETEIEEELRIENNIINLKFRLEKTRLVRQIRKGLNLWKI